MTTSSREERAYHEAAHAVILRVNNIPFGGILMEPDAQGAFQARTYGFDLGDWIRSAGADQEQRIHAALDVLAAGEAAQLQQTANELNSVQGAQKDWKTAVTILRGTSDDQGKPLAGEIMSAWWQASRQRMRELFLAHGREWRAVDALARELITSGDMDFDEIMTVIDPILGSS